MLLLSLLLEQELQTSEYNRRNSMTANSIIATTAVFLVFIFGMGLGIIVEKHYHPKPEIVVPNLFIQVDASICKRTPI